MVPKGWGNFMLSEICSKQISYGIVQTGDNLPKGIPCLRVIDLTKDYISLDDMIKTSLEIHQAYKKTILEEGDIVLALRGEVGLAHLIDESLSGINITRGLARIAADKNKIVPEFLLWALRSTKFRTDLMRRVGGSALQEISLSELRKVEALVPPLSEQKKIAKILSTWDKAITITEQLLSNSQQQKKALMQQLLTGKKRLEGFNQAWSTFKVSEMGSIFSGGTPDTTEKEYWNGNISWLTPTDVTSLKSRYVFSTNKTISEKGLKNSSAKKLPKGALLICTRATIGSMAISTTEITTNQGFKNLVPNSNFSVDFLYYLFNFNVKELVRKSSGSTFLELSKSDFEKLTFLCPCLDEQQKIASVLIVVDNQIAVQQQKISYLKQEKKALIQQLLTGKRRVKTDAA
ncbi:restriction endonuclease subunit S [Serratia marcescens]|nr:restriction endonuclease subunit S [Serratia marcescens]MBH3090237.1 restriction endonuclease subunit S [Serratia marcescens]BEM84921.1 type I restriction-modification enzyme, S subunit [Serratia marcescens]HEJ7105103.1 restriction endonuclease subunit S [Serratia marcescens]HEJ7941700.1 restriction endonuclease subunit S [Serratia marcescens]